MMDPMNRQDPSGRAQQPPATRLTGAARVPWNGEVNDRMAIKTTNPATGDTLRTFEAFSDQEIEARIARAATAYHSYRKTTFGQRADWMHAAAGILEAKAEDIAALMTLEMGKTLKAANAEVAKCAAGARFYAENAERFLADEPADPESVSAARAYTRWQPLGPVLAIMPWNFPLWQVVRFAAPALMAGNVGLLKHASNVPQTALRLQDVFLEAGFPQDVFQTLLIDAEAIEKVLTDTRVVAATLTGSEHAGRSTSRPSPWRRCVPSRWLRHCPFYPSDVVDHRFLFVFVVGIGLLRSRRLDGADAEPFEALAGRIVIPSYEGALLDPATRATQKYDHLYRRLIAWLEHRFDPEPHAPWPRHYQHFGASIAMTTRTYRSIWRLRTRRCFEDIAFNQAWIRHDVRLHHSNKVRVLTSARLTGRARLGLSRELSGWQVRGRKGLRVKVECREFLEYLFTARSRLRNLWSEYQQTRQLCTHVVRDLSRDTGISLAQLVD